MVIAGQGHLSQQPVSRDWEGFDGCPVLLVRVSRPCAPAASACHWHFPTRHLHSHVRVFLEVSRQMMMTGRTSSVLVVSRLRCHGGLWQPRYLKTSFRHSSGEAPGKHTGLFPIITRYLRPTTFFTKRRGLLQLRRMKAQDEVAPSLALGGPCGK